MDMKSGSSEVESKAFKRNLLFELYYAQKEAARFLELAYLALKEDPKIARKVRKTADDAQNQHMRTHGLMIGYQDTAKHVVKSMLPLLKKALEKKKVDLIKKILEKVLGYVNKMIKETKDTKDRYYAIKGEVQDQISDILDKNKEVKCMKTDVEIEQTKLQQLLLSSKHEYDGLQVKTKELAKEIKDFKKKRLEFLDKSIQTEDYKKIESIIDGIFTPGASVLATLAGGPVLGGAVLFGGLVASHLRRNQASNQALAASDKVNENIEKDENKSDDAEKRMLKIKEDSIEKITMLRKLALKKADEIDEKSLEKACQELGEVGKHFEKIAFFWENFAVKLNTLIEEKDVVEVLLDDIHDEDFKAVLDKSTNNITEVWSSFGMVCAFYVNTSEREIHDLYTFLSDPVDQLSIEDCQRRKEKVLAKMEDEVKALKL